MAARSKFTASRRKAILDALRKGHTMNTAAPLNGISRLTGNEWVKRGREAKSEDSLYKQFAEDVDQAVSEFMDKAIGNVVSGMPDDPKLALEVLARRQPDDWAKRERHEVSGTDGGPVRIEVNWPTSTASSEE